MILNRRAQAQDAAPDTASSTAAEKPARPAKKPAAPKHTVTARPKPPEAKPAADVAAGAQASPPAVTAPAVTGQPAPALPDIAASLEKAGAGTCAAQINALAATTMSGVTNSNTAAHWAKSNAERRPVNVFIGQKFNNAGVPYGATGVFAGPNSQGGCDGMAVQVIPSPLSCAKLHDALAARGKQIGDLVGIPLMEDGAGQTLLVPTGADTCVLVGVRTAYAP